MTEALDLVRDDLPVPTGPSVAAAAFFELYPAEVVDRVFELRAAGEGVKAIARKSEVLEEHVRWLLAIGPEGVEFAMRRPVRLHGVLESHDPLDPEQAKRSLARHWFLTSHDLVAQAMALDTEATDLRGEERNKVLYRKQNLLRTAAMAVDKFLDLTDGRRGLGSEINARAEAKAYSFQYVSNIDRGDDED